MSLFQALLALCNPILSKPKPKPKEEPPKTDAKENGEKAKNGQGDAGNAQPSDSQSQEASEATKNPEQDEKPTVSSADMDLD